MANRIPADAFEHYVSLGGSRSYQLVADHFGVSKRAVVKKATKESWQSRLRQAETKAARITDKRVLEDMETMKTRHLKALKVIQGKALETLRQMPLKTGMDAVRALTMALKQELDLRGATDEQANATVEDIIKREYSRWVTIADDSDS